MSDETAPRTASLDALLAERAWVARLSRRLVADPATADDLVQQTWLRFLRTPPSRGGSVRAWLRAVVTNEARQSWRAGSRREGHESTAAAAPRATPPAPDEIVARAEEQRRVAQAVMELEEPYRTTVLLAFYEGLAPSEIAARTGDPVETVRTRTKRALARLRGRLDASKGGDGSAWAMALLPLAEWTRADAVAAAASGTRTASVAATLAAEGGTVVAATKKTVVLAALLAFGLGVGGTLGVQTLAGAEGEHATLSADATGAAVAPPSGPSPRVEPSKPHTLRANAADRMQSPPGSASSESPAESGTTPPVDSGTLSGRTIDPDGRPVADVTIRAYRRRQRMVSGGWGQAAPDPSGADQRISDLVDAVRFEEDHSHWTKSDAQGAYRIEGLASGKWILLGWKTGYAVQLAEQPVNSEVRAGTRQDLVARPLAGLVAEVLAADGTPVAYAKIGIRRTDTPPSSRVLNTLAWNRDAGTTWVWESGRRELFAIGDGDEETASDPQTIELVAGRTTGPATFRLRPRRGIRGRVVFPTGLVFESAKVRALRLDHGERPEWPALFKSPFAQDVGRGNGRTFEFLDVEPGRWHVGLTLDGDESFAWSDVVDVAGRIAELEIAAPAPTLGSWIGLRAEGPDGEPVRKVEISVRSRIGNASHSGGAGATARADDGTIWMPVRTSEHDLDDADAATIEFLSDAHGVVSVPWIKGSREVVVARFAPPARLAVSLPASAPKELADGFSLSVYPKGGGSSRGFAPRGPDGRWIAGPLQPGTYLVTACVRQGPYSLELLRQEITLAQGIHDLPLVLPRLRRVVLRLADRPRGSTVSIQAAPQRSTSSFLSVEVGRDGAATFPFVPEGRWSVHVGGEYETHEFDVSGADVDLTIPK